MPIISLMNWIREYLMRRFAKNRILCERYKGSSKICPRPRKRLEKHVLESAKWRASWAEGSKYECSVAFCVMIVTLVPQLSEDIHFGPSNR
ncbi:hypothetical protein Cni_G05663 [Canna indica]|uniref:Uncharacterized protein n=1 Tax=Canna indica TaxID=4628 RepID=A0AAQ3Q582_9LILI|nr:hypothetical protein Cni_G05663 [Canna indica]